MKIAMFSSKRYDREFFDAADTVGYELVYLSPRLGVDTVALARGADVACCFVNDGLDAEVLKQLKAAGVRLVALRCAGFNNVDLDAAKSLGLPVCRVPGYSPHSVAEHACALILDLNRNIHRAHNRIRENDYSLDGLLGFDLYGTTVGVVGAGKIGQAFARIMSGFGCKILVADPNETIEPNGADLRHVELDELLAESHIISLHCPLVRATHHMIDSAAIERMRPGVMLINTSRGALIDAAAVVKGLKAKKIGYLGLDVYEEESELFFEDLSNTFIDDDIFARLQTFPNVIITGHQAFFTREALTQIAEVTLRNIECFEAGDLHKANVLPPLQS